MKEQDSVDNYEWSPGYEPWDPFKNAVEKLAQERVKYIENYMKFWLAVNAGEALKYITPESFAKDYHLLEKHFEDNTIGYQMLPHYEMVIDKTEYARLKLLDDNRKKKIAAFKECINGKFGKDYQVKIELLESLDK